MICYFVARRTDADDETAMGKIDVFIDRNTNAASTSLSRAIIKTVSHEDDSNLDINVTANTTYGGPEIQVTGVNSKTINWVVYAQVVQVKG